MKPLITIGASTVPGELILPRLLPKILERNPEIALRLVVTNSLSTYESVRRGDFQMGVIGAPFVSDEVNFREVLDRDRLVLIASKKDPIARKGALSIADLRGQPFINREEGSGTRLNYERAFREAGLSGNDLDIVAEISDTEGILQAVQAGAGLAVVSEAAAQASLCGGEIAILDPPFQMLRSFYIITRKSENTTPIMQAIMEDLAEAFQERAAR